MPRIRQKAKVRDPEVDALVEKFNSAVTEDDFHELEKGVTALTAKKLRESLPTKVPQTRGLPLAVSLSQPVITQTPTANPEDGGDIIFTAGLPGVAGPDGQPGGRGGRIVWQIPNGLRIIMHGADAEHSFTLEKGDEVMFSLPKDITGGKYSLEDMVREIVQCEIRLATIAGIREAVKRELEAVKGYGAAASKVAADLREMGLDGKE